MSQFHQFSFSLKFLSPNDAFESLKINLEELLGEDYTDPYFIVEQDFHNPYCISVFNHSHLLENNNTICKYLLHVGNIFNFTGCKSIIITSITSNLRDDENDATLIICDFDRNECSILSLKHITDYVSSDYYLTKVGRPTIKFKNIGKIYKEV